MQPSPDLVSTSTLLRYLTFAGRYKNKLICTEVYVESSEFCLSASPYIFCLLEMLIIDRSITITYCDVTQESRINLAYFRSPSTATTTSTTRLSFQSGIHHRTGLT